MTAEKHKIQHTYKQKEKQKELLMSELHPIC